MKLRKNTINCTRGTPQERGLYGTLNDKQLSILLTLTLRYYANEYYGYYVPVGYKTRRDNALNEVWGICIKYDVIFSMKHPDEQLLNKKTTKFASYQGDMACIFFWNPVNPTSLGPTVFNGVSSNYPIYTQFTTWHFLFATIEKQFTCQKITVPFYDIATQRWKNRQFLLSCLSHDRIQHEGFPSELQHWDVSDQKTRAWPN